MAVLSYTQETFEGGMNLVNEETKIPVNQYLTGINVRTRFGSADPVFDLIDITSNIDSTGLLFQGFYAFGDILVCFIGGLAYYRNVTTDITWTLVAGFSMSAEVATIYACAVPSATNQYIRENITADSPNSGVIFNPAGPTGSPIALVCQDGINQPWLILADGTARVSSDYTAWDKTTNREYVPIGLQMIYFGGNLFIVAADGTHVYRSVSGRPLDFVIAIDNNGDKVADAEPLSFAVDSNTIKLIAPLTSESFVIITSYAAWLVIPDTSDLLYGEPTFNQTFLFAAGTINQFCFADILGDFAFIDREGLKSFNGVQQLKFEGNNSVFSLAVAKLFTDIIQDTTPCVGSFDNYTFFSVKTSLNPASILVYDNIRKCFPSVDLLSVKQVKQFAVTYSAAKQRFYGITDTEVYELYSTESTTPKQAVIFTRGLDSRNSDQGPTDGLYNIKSQSAKLVFEDGLEDGEVTFNELVNNAQIIESVDIRDIPPQSGGVLYPVTGPVIPVLASSIVPLDLAFANRREGQKLAYVVTWTGGSKLSYLVNRCACTKAPTSIQQQSTIYTAAS